MSHISVIAAIALPENLEEAARSIPDEVIKQGMDYGTLPLLFASTGTNISDPSKILLSRINIAMRAWPRPYPIRSWPHIV